MKNKNNYSIQTQLEDNINLKDEIEKYIVHWKWFVLSLFLILTLGFLYLRYTTPKYEIKSVILIKDDNSSFSSEFSAFKDLGLFGGNGSNIENEIELLKSRTLAQQVAKELKLNISYFVKGRVKENEIYKEERPIELLLSDDFSAKKMDTTFYVNPVSETEYNITSQDKSVIETRIYGVEYKIKKSFYTVLKNPNYKANSQNNEVRVSVQPFEKAVSFVVNKVKIEQAGKFSSVLTLSMFQSVKEKAIDVLNTLVEKYNQDAVNDKSEVGTNTTIFIKNRLDIIKEDLGIVDKKVENFKKENNFTNIEEEASQFVQTLTESKKEILDKTIQLRLIQYMNDYLSSKNQEYELMPANLGISDPSIAVLIQKYNEALLKRNRLMQGSSIDNPSVIAMDYQLKSIRKSLKESLKNNEASFKITLDELNKKDEIINSEIKSIPGVEREFRNIKRQQSIKEALYLYLLQKQEETEISLAVITSNSKVIDRAFASLGPVSPSSKIVLLAAFLLSMLIPGLVIYVKNLLDTKLHTRNDLETSVDAPILGDIPINTTKESIVVTEGGRSSAAEAFRLLRTNLDFMLTGVDRNCKSIFVTSTTSGEGKSFVSVNLACTLALSGKKVALIGMDLRAPKITEYLGLPNFKGITNYIKDTSINIEDLKIPFEGYEGLDIYASGVIPPNPAELLMNSRIEDMFEKFNSIYDYIVVDTAPVNLVTDTLMVSKYADMFIYVARAGYLDKRLLAIPQNLYSDKRLPNMAMLINASDYKKSYGYGAYGAYGYGEIEDLPWWKTIFK